MVSYTKAPLEGLHHGTSLEQIASECDPTLGANGIVLDYLFLGSPSRQYLVCDMAAPDFAIIACSQAWLDRCGYTSDDLIGRNCRMLQGPETCSRAIDEMARAVEAGTTIYTGLINYRYDGSMFLNEFMLVPLVNRNNRPRFYVSIHETNAQIQRDLAAHGISVNRSEITAST